MADPHSTPKKTKRRISANPGKKRDTLNIAKTIASGLASAITGITTIKTLTQRPATPDLALKLGSVGADDPNEITYLLCFLPLAASRAFSVFIPFKIWNRGNKTADDIRITVTTPRHLSPPPESVPQNPEAATGSQTIEGEEAVTTYPIKTLNPGEEQRFNHAIALSLLGDQRAALGHQAYGNQPITIQISGRDIAVRNRKFRLLFVQRGKDIAEVKAIIKTVLRGTDADFTTVMGFVPRLKRTGGPHGDLYVSTGHNDIVRPRPR